MARKKPTASADGPLPDPGPAPTTPARPYLVLARKYRPRTFDDLIGQEAMVRTLRNAFATGRIAQAYMLTGVRGVGKTTTARILARAFNYQRDGAAGPRIDMPELGDHCQAIMESRHPDVIEMDAASNTGVDNIREIVESVRYHPVSAPTKVFIVDEVHMLSKGAFNALLKTLEEPPPHVRFIFATTEIRKVPLTVLSRCQRFDLRRVPTDRLMTHFKAIAEKESVEIADDALRLIARAGGGSVRDGLSILDQAFATATGPVEAALVRDMLGLADGGRVLELLQAALAGRAKDGLDLLDRLNADGAEPLAVLAELAEAVHGLTRLKIAGAADVFAGDDVTRAKTLADALGLALLSRAWQMLMAGLTEARGAADARTAADMLIVRLAHMASLPSPDELARRLGSGATPTPAARSVERSAPAGTTAAPREVPAATAPIKPAAEQRSFANYGELVTFIGERRDALLKIELEERVSLVRFDPPRIELRLLDGAAASLAGDLAEKLKRWTGTRWIVVLSREAGARPLGEVRRESEADEIARLKELPALKAALRHFPDAEIAAVTLIDAEPSLGKDKESSGR